MVMFTPLPSIPILSEYFFNRLICTGLNLGLTQDFRDFFVTNMFFSTKNVNLKPENFMQGEWREENIFIINVLESESKEANSSVLCSKESLKQASEDRSFAYAAGEL